MTDSQESRKPEPIPDVTDWQIVECGDEDVYVESETISHHMRDYDDAWLKVVGNMTHAEKLELAKFVANNLNRRAPVKELSREAILALAEKAGFGQGSMLPWFDEFVRFAALVQEEGK